jgi:hypothetical protein
VAQVSVAALLHPAQGFLGIISIVRNKGRFAHGTTTPHPQHDALRGSPVGDAERLGEVKRFQLPEKRRGFLAHHVAKQNAG